jgi:tetratricopeptide (TPR) repeat protein
MCASEPATPPSGRLDKLLAMLDREPNDAFCLYGVAQEHAKQGRHDVALQWFDRALAADGDSAYAYFHKARSLQELARNEDAATTVRAGMQAALRSKDSHAHAELAALLDELGEES